MRALAVVGVVAVGLAATAYFIVNAERPPPAAPETRLGDTAIPSHPLFPAHVPDDQPIVCVGRVPIHNDKGEPREAWAFLVVSDTKPTIRVETQEP